MTHQYITAAFEIGEYWAKKTQIDLVGLRTDDWTDLGECKWGNVDSLSRLCEDLEHKVGCFPNRRNATIGRRLFVRKNLGKTTIPGVKVHSLEDLYGD